MSKCVAMCNATSIKNASMHGDQIHWCVGSKCIDV